MMEKAFESLYRAYLTAKFRVMRFMQEEEGNEMVNTIILVAIGVIIAAVIVNLVTGDGHDGKSGLIHDIFEAIKDKLSELGLSIGD